jgi:hypothetical protein
MVAFVTLMLRLTGMIRELRSISHLISGFSASSNRVVNLRWPVKDEARMGDEEAKDRHNDQPENVSEYGNGNRQVEIPDLHSFQSNE